MKHPIVASIVLFIVVCAATFGLNYRIEQEKVEQQHMNCLQDQRQYDTLRALIAETAKPGPQGSAIDHLVIPPDTPPSVLSILQQLNTTNNPPDEHALDRFYAVLKQRPQC